MNPKVKTSFGSSIGLGRETAGTVIGTSNSALIADLLSPNRSSKDDLSTTISPEYLDDLINVVGKYLSSENEPLNIVQLSQRMQDMPPKLLADVLLRGSSEGRLVLRKQSSGEVTVSLPR